MSYQTDIAAAVWTAGTRTTASGSGSSDGSYAQEIAEAVWTAGTRTLSVVSTLAYSSSEIMFDGRELRVKFTANGTLPAAGTIYPFDSEGVPDLRDSSNLRIPLVYKTCDCKINRTSGDITVWACYEIPNQALADATATYIAKGDTGLTVTMAAGMVSEEGGLETGAVSAQAVTNSSEVGSDGWCDIDSHGYTPASGHVTVYCNPTKADDSGDGLSWANAKKTLSAAVTVLNAQTNSRPHRLLIANGTTWDGTTGSVSMTRSGASATSKLWIGGADSGDSSTVRPIIMAQEFYWASSGDFVHLDALDIQFGTGASTGSALCSIGNNSSTNVSMSNCKVNFPQVVQALHTHRNIYTGNSGANPRSTYQGSGQVTNFYDNHIVNYETDKAAATVGGHLTYDIGETASTDAVQTGSQLFERNTVVGRVGVRDLGRERGESLFWSIACMVGFDTGGAPTVGVDQVTTPTCTYNHATRTLTRNSGTTSNCHVWANNTFLFGVSGTGVTPGYFQVASITSTTFVLSGDGLGAGADGSANVVIRMGDIPARSRNWNGRHIFNLDAGNFYTNDWFLYPNPVPYLRDTAGYWYRDSGGTAVSRQTGNARGQIGMQGGRSSDGGDLLIDTHMERVSALRMRGFGMDLRPKLYSAENQAQSWYFRKSILDAFDIASQRNIVRASSLQTASGVVNYNVYATPSSAAAFCYTDTHPDLNQTFANWKTSTGWDAASVHIGTIAITAGATTSDSPDAEDYDAIRPDCAWGETGTLGTRERLANAMASRPANQWDYNLTAQAMVAWLLEQMRPTDFTTWVTEPAGAYGYIGAADYSLTTPANVTEVFVANTSAFLTWDETTDSKVVGHVVKWGTVSGTLDNEQWVWIDDSIVLTSLPANTTIYYRVYATDGQNLSDPTAEGSFTTQAIVPVESTRIYGTGGINVDRGAPTAWTNAGNVTGAASGDFASASLSTAGQTTSDDLTTTVPATAIAGTMIGMKIGVAMATAAAPSSVAALAVVRLRNADGSVAVSWANEPTVTTATLTEYENYVTLDAGTWADVQALIAAGVTAADDGGIPTGLSLRVSNDSASATEFRPQAIWLVPVLQGSSGGGGGASVRGATSLGLRKAVRMTHF